MQRKEPRYADGIEYWECPTCKRWLPRDDYYPERRNRNGLKSQCKVCHTKGNLATRDPDNKRRLNREYMRRARLADPEKVNARARENSRRHPADPVKVKARQVLNSAVRSGRLTRPEECPACEYGGKITAHHPDYSKPLDVEWCCYECHGNR